VRDNPLCTERGSRSMICIPRMGTEGVGESCRDMALTNLASDAVTLESMVARLNIEHYRKVLSEEIDQTKRQTLLQLIAEEKAKLSALLPSSVM
jgi:hypothetical protein